MKMPSGRYFLCDPCYVVDDDQWTDGENYCNKIDEQIFQFMGKTVCVFGTLYGDGTYQDQFGNEFGVDAGIIGLTPVEICSSPSDGNIMVNFSEEFEVSCENGLMKFGPHIIDTGDVGDFDGE